MFPCAPFILASQFCLHPHRPLPSWDPLVTQNQLKWQITTHSPNFLSSSQSGCIVFSACVQLIGLSVQSSILVQMRPKSVCDELMMRGWCTGVVLLEGVGQGRFTCLIQICKLWHCLRNYKNVGTCVHVNLFFVLK